MFKCPVCDKEQRMISGAKYGDYCGDCYRKAVYDDLKKCVSDMKRLEMWMYLHGPDEMYQYLQKHKGD